MRLPDSLRNLTVAFAATFTLLAAASADDAAVIAALEPKGVKFRKEQDGTVSEVSVSENARLTIEDYRRFRELKGPKRLNLSPKDPALNDEVLAAIGALPTVERFFSNGSQFTDEGLKGFSGWTGLRNFGFDHWFGPEGMKAYVGPGLRHLAALPNLVHVRLGGCRVDNQACSALAQVKTLESVDLFHTFAVTDEGIVALKALPKLKVIVLGPQWSPRITDVSLQHLGEIPTLEDITVVETILTYDGGLAHLKKLKNLKKLDLGTCVITENDFARLKADHPAAQIKWAAPPEEQAAKVRADFARHAERKKKEGRE